MFFIIVLLDVKRWTWEKLKMDMVKLDYAPKLMHFSVWPHLFFLCQLFTLFLLLYPLFSMNIGFSPFFFHTLQIILISHGFVWMKDGVIVQWATCFLRNWWKSAAACWTTWCCVRGLKFQFQPSSTPILSAILYQNLSRRESTLEKPLSKLTKPTRWIGS